MDNLPGIVDGTTIKCKRAWLVTWEWEGDHAQVDKKLVAILNYRYSSRTIGRFIERFYASNWFAYHGQLAYAKDRKLSPYQVQRGSHPDEVLCGGNPWLKARMVHDIQAYVDEDGNEHLKWKESPEAGGKECHLASSG